MSALKEYAGTRQIKGEPERRWFSTPELDLIVWVNEMKQPFAFQFCYDKLGREHALTWEPDSGYHLAAVDSGEERGLHHKGSPTLNSDESFDRDRVAGLFAAAAGELPAPITKLVAQVLAAWPHSPALPVRRA